MIKYFINEKDTAHPIVEVNYADNTWRVVSFIRCQYGDEFISGKIRKPTDFTWYPWKEVPKPQPEHGRKML